jgi:hypothetical protein
MARALRIEYGGAIYHVMNRGDRRRVGAPTQKRRAENPDRTAVACGDGGDVEMDRRGIAHGNVDAREQPAGATAGANPPN